MATIQHENNNVYYSTNLQLKIAGPIIELRKYGRQFFVGDRPRSMREKTKKEEKEYSDDELQIRRYRRSKRELYDYINCNAWEQPDLNGVTNPPLFLTLTFAENIEDIPAANREFSKFIQRLNFYLTNAKRKYLKYVVVIEFQKRGAIHYHALFFNMPYIIGLKQTITRLWANGFINMKSTGRIRNIALYMSKYMSKRFDDPRLHGKKCYFVSRGLTSPTLVYYDNLIHEFLTYLPTESIEYEKTGIPAGEYMQTVDLTHYNLKEYPENRASALAFLKGTGYDGPGRTPPNKIMEIPNF